MQKNYKNVIGTGVYNIHVIIKKILKPSKIITRIWFNHSDYKSYTKNNI